MAGDGTSPTGGVSEATRTCVGPFDDPDRYDLVEMCSRGGEGELWRAAIRLGGMPVDVAVKVVHAHHLGDLDQWHRRWHQQAELVRCLDHPSLVRIRDVFEGPLPHRPGAADPTGRTLYLVMNWVPGATLVDWVASRPDRTLAEVVAIVSRVAAAIDYLHSGTATGRPILHRDVKPANVVVDGDRATLVDFGFVRLVEDGPVSMAGTPSYFAPELLRGAPFTEAADRYALGATAFFAVTGEPPVTGDQARARAALAAAPVLEGRADLADHVLAMMDPDPARRPRSTVAWAQALARRAVRDTAEVANPVPPPPVAPVVAPPRRPAAPPRPPTAAVPVAAAAPPPARRRRWPLAVAAVAALLLGALGAYALTRSGDDGPPTVAVGDDPDPSAGTTPPSATQATVTPSSGTAPSAPVMVEVTGLPRQQAETALRDAGIPYDVVEQEGGGPVGTVVGQEPGAGDAVAGRAVLTVAVPPAVMPDLAGLALAEAEDLLADAGATVTVVEVLDETGPDGTVVGQAPAAGEPFATSVELEVARRPVAVFLADLDPVDGAFVEAQATVAGTNHVHSLVQSTRTTPRSVEYDLGGRFRRFRAVLGQRDDSEAGATVRFEVLADGRPLLVKDLVLGQAEAVDLDVTGVGRLRLVVTELGEDAPERVYAVVGDGHVLGLPSEIDAAGD